MSLFSTIKKTIGSDDSQNQSLIYEISPARLLSKGVYEYCLPAPFFNEYLSQIAQLQCWHKIYSGHQHYYYLNDLILTVNPDGKQSCSIPKLVEDSYWTHPDLIKGSNGGKDHEESVLKEAQTRIERVAVGKETTGTNNGDLTTGRDDVGGEYEDYNDEISLKTNLRFRVVRQIPISHNRFPPVDQYHFQERKVYRTYVNSEVTIHFEILRPIECQKKFEDLLLPKPESKFLIKIWIKDTKNLEKYLKWFIEDCDLNLTTYD